MVNLAHIECLLRRAQVQCLVGTPSQPLYLRVGPQVNDLTLGSAGRRFTLLGCRVEVFASGRDLANRYFATLPSPEFVAAAPAELLNTGA